jgi:hypothetical protein
MRSRFFLSVLLLNGASLAALAQGPPMIPEIQVNTYTTTAPQALPSVAMDGGGDFVVVWPATDGDGGGVAWRAFDPSGAPLTPQFTVNTYTTSNQSYPAVAADRNGDFVVVWTSDGQIGSGADVFARLYINGDPTGPEFLVNTYTTGDQYTFGPQTVAMAPSGEFVVVWVSTGGQDGDGYGIFGQRFDASGNKLGTEFQVNTYTTGNQKYAGVAMNAGREFVVAWQSFGEDGNGYGTIARLYDGTGAPVTGDIVVNTSTTGDQADPQVAMDRSGNFVVVWDSSDGSAYGIFGRRFDSTGAPLTGEIAVNTYTTDNQDAPAIAMDPDGNFVCVWQSHNQDGDDWGVYAQAFDSSASPVGTEFRINATTALRQWTPAIVMGHHDSFAAVFSGLTTPAEEDVFARLSAPFANFSDVDVRSVTGSSSNANGVLEAGETVQVSPHFFNITAAPLALTATASNIRGPAGPTYTIDDDTADYGAIPSQMGHNCFGATGDCYLVTVSGARPAPHWDVQFDERLSTGMVKTRTLHVGESFPDVPTTNNFYLYIETLFHAGITGGCAGGGYCPTNDVTRAQMAVFLLKTEHGAGYLPPACAGIFTDVPCPSQFADWIERLYAEQITGGCVASPLQYCPNHSVTRAQMAVFLLKVEHGAAYAPPACNSVFGDVACPSTFANWIEQLYAEQVTGGCQASPLLYCPNNPNTRGQMAVFITKTFGIKLYPP